MIFGIGLDVTELDRITKAYERRKEFAERVLTEKELTLFRELGGSRQMEFLAGRLRSQRSLLESVRDRNRETDFPDVEVLPGAHRKPEITKSPFVGNCFVSITHSGNIIAAQVILEK